MDSSGDVLELELGCEELQRVVWGRGGSDGGRLAGRDGCMRFCFNSVFIVGATDMICG